MLSPFIRPGRYRYALTITTRSCGPLKTCWAWCIWVMRPSQSSARSGLTCSTPAKARVTRKRDRVLVGVRRRRTTNGTRHAAQRRRHTPWGMTRGAARSRTVFFR